MDLYFNKMNWNKYQLIPVYFIKIQENNLKDVFQKSLLWKFHKMIFLIQEKKYIPEKICLRLQQK